LRKIAHRVIPALLMSAGLAVPVVTTVELMSHASFTSAGAATPSGTGGGKGSTPAGHTSSGTNTPSTPPQSSGSGTGSGSTTPSQSGKSGSFTGDPVQDNFGSVQTTITVSRGKITNVSISAPMDSQVSQMINSQAVPMLQSQVLSAQSANINGVSGATETAYAAQQSLQSALRKAGL
jgi:uncharacterized protein with FMN-binding domain